MLFNCNVSTNEKGNILIEVPVGITNDMNQEDVYNHLQSIMDTPHAYKKEYPQRDGSINQYVYFSNIQDRGGRYEIVTVGGVDFRIKLDVVLTSKVVEEFKPINEKDELKRKYGEMLDEGLINQAGYEALLATI